jgi:hypothetical protein
VNGEWLSYSVNAASAGVYAVSYSLCGAPPSPVPLDIFLTTEATCAGTQFGAYTAAFNTGSYTAFKTFAASSITLPAGNSVLRVCMVTASYLIFGSFSVTLQGKHSAVLSV